MYVGKCLRVSGVNTVPKVKTKKQVTHPFKCYTGKKRKEILRAIGSLVNRQKIYTVLSKGTYLAKQVRQQAQHFSQVRTWLDSFNKVSLPPLVLGLMSGYSRLSLHEQISGK